MSYYPSALPEPAAGNTFTTAENRLTTEGDIAPINRILDKNHKQTLTLSWILTEQQFRIFESWHRWRLFDGVSRFDMSWGGRAGRARFTGVIEANLDGVNWSLSGEAEVDYAVSV